MSKVGIRRHAVYMQKTACGFIALLQVTHQKHTARLHQQRVQRQMRGLDRKTSLTPARGIVCATERHETGCLRCVSCFVS